MDLAAVLGPEPELCLIDELARANAPGGRAREALRRRRARSSRTESTCTRRSTSSTSRASTTRSPADGHAKVRETMPDRVLSTADEIVLVDLPPEALIARLRAGKVYHGETAFRRP